LLSLELFALAVIFVLNAIFAAAEIAMASLSRAKLSEMASRHPSWRTALELWKNNPSQLLTTVLVSSNIAVVGLSSVSTVLGLEMHRSYAWPDWLVAAFVVSLSVLATLLSEIAPKVLAKRHPERVAFMVIPIMQVVETILGPFIRLLVKLIRLLTRPFGGEEGESFPSVTEEELVHLVDESAKAGALEQEESEMIQSVIAFGDTVVREVMIPRTQIDAISVRSTVDQVLDRFLDTGYTRLPVIDGDLDHIKGLLYAKDLLAVLRERQLIILQDIIRPVFFVPESKKVSELLREFRKGRKHMAIVVDEYGGTAGIVTLEDLVEEIIGEIHDEYDVEAGPLKTKSQTEWEVQSDLSLFDFGAEIGVDFPEEGEATSVGGFVSEHLGRIPQKGSKLEWGDLSFEVLEASDRQVKRLHVRRSPKPEPKND
jgi:CBS domain containing-hemolysin-like protein